MNLLDRIDKQISRCVFYLELGKVEWIIAFFGVWHGVPLTSLGFPIPQVAVLIASGPSVGSVAAIVVPFLVMAPIYIMCILRGSIATFYSVRYLVPSLLAGFTVSSLLGERALAAHIFYLCSYFITQMFVLTGKVFTRRLRPGSCMEEELMKVQRELPPLNYIGKTGHTVFESFPSGDAAGAMCLSAAAYAITGYTQRWVFAFGFLSAFGRMYFFAHHFGDVSVGIGIAAAVVFAADAVLSWETFGVFHFCFLFPVFVLFYGQISKFKKDVPPKYRSRDGSSLGEEEKKIRWAKMVTFHSYYERI